MRKFAIRAAIAVAAGAFALVGRVGAQQQQGDKELGIGGNIQYMTTTGEGSASGSSFFGSVFGSLGMFVTRSLKAAVGTSLTLSSPAGQGTSTSGLLNYGVSYYFGGAGAKTYPYVGVGGITQISSQEGSSSSTNISGIVGLQHYFSRNASLFGEVDYTPIEGAVLIPISFGFRIIF